MAVDDPSKLTDLLKRSEPVTWVFAGDSITHGAVHTFGCRSYVEHFAERVRTEVDRRRDIVINAGVNGARCPDLFAQLENLVLRFRPQVISVMIGMNDAAAGTDGVDPFRSSFSGLLAALRRETSAVIICHTPNAITPAEVLRKELPRYVGVIREAAALHHAILVDQFRAWESRGDAIQSLLDDGTIHPNHFGHVFLAHEMFRGLGLWDAASATCRLFVP